MTKRTCISRRRRDICAAQRHKIVSKSVAIKSGGGNAVNNCYSCQTGKKLASCDMSKISVYYSIYSVKRVQSALQSRRD